MIELIHTDCLEYMRTCNDNQFDLAICDPPYGMTGNTFCSTRGTKSFQRLDRGGRTGISLGDRPDEKYFNELFRVSKNQIIFGMQYFVNYLQPHQCVLVWDKLNGMNRFSDIEIAWTSFETATRVVNRWMEPMNRIHPTQKPVALYKWILNEYATKGMNLLDTHLGSGNIAIAAHYAGMNLTGLEINEKYYNAAKKNFQDNTQQTILTF